MPRVPETCQKSLRWRLREATRPQHDAVEDYLAVLDRMLSTSEYRRLLERMWGFYTPLEKALLRLNWPESGIVIAERCKSGWLRSDLTDLGYETQQIDRLPQCSAIPIVDSVPKGLGVLYVLEGATLGGQVILRQLAPDLGIGPSFAGRFYASYGADVGRKWRSYLTALDAVGRCRDTNAAIEDAAIETFGALHAWLESAGGVRHRLDTEARAE